MGTTFRLLSLWAEQFEHSAADDPFHLCVLVIASGFVALELIVAMHRKDLIHPVWELGDEVVAQGS